MRSRAEIKDLPVVDVDSGRVLGRVKELLVDLSHGRVTGLLVAAGRRQLFLPFDKVETLGDSVVTVGAAVSLEPAHDVDPQDGPVGKRVVNRDGRLLGQVGDIIFDAESGCLWGYELSAGVLADFVEGRKAVALTDELVIGPDSVITPDGALPYPEEIEGGV